eukprot:9368072-Alexandrium_andersonii.AAC.1
MEPRPRSAVDGRVRFLRLPCPCFLAPRGAGAAADPPGPETGLGPSTTWPLTAASDGVLVRLQE